MSVAQVCLQYIYCSVLPGWCYFTGCLLRTSCLLLLQAIKLFADARPPGIYKPDYIKSLYKFYHETKQEMVVCPPTPEWKRSSDLDLNGEALPDDDDDGGSAAPLHVCGL